MRVSFAFFSLSLVNSQAERHEDSTSWLQFEKAAAVQVPASCGSTDLGCQAQQLACNLASLMVTDWPVSSYPQLNTIHTQLQEVCQGAPPTLAEVDEETSLDLSQRAEEHQPPSFTCPAPQQCALDVVNYVQKQNPGIK